jgi:phosphoribosylglycinamide formyltransferase 1
MLRIAIMIGQTGRGSNMLALGEKISDDPNMCLDCVIAPNMESPGVRTATSRGFPVKHVAYSPAESYGSRLVEALSNVNWICLAGFMKLVPREVLDRFPNRILNIHPALLPKFGGKGMYGMHVHEAVIAAKEKESGCTVHFVSDRYDEGEIILKAKCSVLSSDTPQSLAERVLTLEHQTYFCALQRVIDGK